MGLLPSYQVEGRVFARYLSNNDPNGKVGVLYQNDDYGKDYVKGFKDGLGGKIPIIAETPYETTDPTVDSQIINLKASGANVLFDVTLSKFASQAIRKIAEIGWHPVHLLNSVSASIGEVLKPAGLEISRGVLSATYIKDPTDPAWKDDPGFKEWLAFMHKYYPEGDRTSGITATAHMAAQTLVAVLKQSGDDLTRENIMKQAANLKNLAPSMLLPGITINTGPNDYAPIKQMQMMRFSGESWERFGPLMNSEVGG